jgi:hypothetical protein
MEILEEPRYKWIAARIWRRMFPVRPKAIGYWWSTLEPHFPKPTKFQVGELDLESLELISNYLDSHRAFAFWMGVSDCRLCEQYVGSVDLTDGVYYWPEGLSHYVREHKVKLPVEFIEHCKKSNPPLTNWELLMVEAGKIAWWCDQKADSNEK